LYTCRPYPHNSCCYRQEPFSSGQDIRPCTCNPCNGPSSCKQSDQKLKRIWATNNSTSSLVVSLASVIGALRLLVVCRAFLLTRAPGVVAHSTPTLQSFAVLATSLRVVFFTRSLGVWNTCWRNNESRWWKREWNDGR
jgi:hypothetical protein